MCDKLLFVQQDYTVQTSVRTFWKVDCCHTFRTAWLQFCTLADWPVTHGRLKCLHACTSVFI